MPSVVFFVLLLASSSAAAEVLPEVALRSGVHYTNMALDFDFTYEASGVGPAAELELGARIGSRWSAGVVAGYWHFDDDVVYESARIGQTYTETTRFRDLTVCARATWWLAPRFGVVGSVGFSAATGHWPVSLGIVVNAVRVGRASVQATLALETDVLDGPPFGSVVVGRVPLMVGVAWN
jgi:hypothetical protein